MTETQVGIGMKPVQRQLLKGLIASARANPEAGPEDAMPSETPHHRKKASGTESGSGTAAALGAELLSTQGAGITFSGGKHAMFSYQWDVQTEILRVRKHFAQIGIPVWMDVDGGMAADIYDSMAAAVSKAAVVVAFLSQKYQVWRRRPSCLLGEIQTHVR